MTAYSAIDTTPITTVETVGVRWRLWILSNDRGIAL